jgi:mannosyl-glycoprotein endo-beta-N-acetylglucosaminidase
VQDIYMGVDVWGRGSHGGGGFGLYRALDHIAPQRLGLSTALFAQGWTWETEENNPGWNWDQFWDTDSRLWVGPASGNVTVPPLGIKGGETPCTHGPFKPISDYYLHLPPPEPHDLPYYTTFSPGIGDSWFVEGKKVWQSVRGWTDMDKQTLVGDLIWPRPKVTRLDGRTDTPPIGITKFNFADAWNGGNSVSITLSIPGSNSQKSALWVPIQTINLISRRKYEASAVYKIPDIVNASAEVIVGLRSTTNQDLMSITSSSTISLANGWSKAVVQFEIPTPAAGGPILTQGQLGLIVAVALKNPAPAVEVPFLVGQLVVHPNTPPSYQEYDVIQHWIYFEQTPGATKVDGTLNWEVAVAFDTVPPISINDPEDTRIPWSLQPTKKHWFPRFLYFNIYVQQLPNGPGSEPGPLTWIGTSTYINIGDKKTFPILQDNLPYTSGDRRYDFKVQPVLETGEIYPGWMSFESARVAARELSIEEVDATPEEGSASRLVETGSSEPLTQEGDSKKNRSSVAKEQGP